MAKSLEKRVRAVKLEIYLHTFADGSTKVESTITYKCKDKPTAVDLVEQYVKHNKRDGSLPESVKA